MKRPCIQQAQGVYEKIRERNAHTSKVIPKEKNLSVVCRWRRKGDMCLSPALLLELYKPHFPYSSQLLYGKGPLLSPFKSC